MAAGRSL